MILSSHFTYSLSALVDKKFLKHISFWNQIILCEIYAGHGTYERTMDTSDGRDEEHIKRSATNMLELMMKSCIISINNKNE